jgi:hypothetical protein
MIMTELKSRVKFRASDEFTKIKRLVWEEGSVHYSGCTECLNLQVAFAFTEYWDTHATCTNAQEKILFGICHSHDNYHKEPS